MPSTKVTPIAPKGGGVGEGGVEVAVAPKPSTTRPNAVARPNPGGKAAGPRGSKQQQSFDSSQFSAATARLTKATKEFSEITRAGCKNSAPSIAFVCVVGFSLVGLGIFLVYHGDDNYIIDLMVVGGLCLVTGTFSVILGFIVIIGPVVRERRRMKARQKADRLTMVEGPFTHQLSTPRKLQTQQRNYSDNPVFIEEDDDVVKRAAGTSTAAPRGDQLYVKDAKNPERRSSVAEQAAGGTVAAAAAVAAKRRSVAVPSPPLLFQPLVDKEGTSSSVLTSNLASDSDVESDREREEEYTTGTWRNKTNLGREDSGSSQRDE